MHILLYAAVLENMLNVYYACTTEVVVLWTNRQRVDARQKVSSSKWNSKRMSLVEFSKLKYIVQHYVDHA